MEEVDKKETEEEKYKPAEQSEIDMLNPEIPKKQEVPVNYSTVAVTMYKHQKDFVNSIQKILGFNTKSVFMRHALLSFCMEQRKILDAKYQADKDFKVAYSKWRRKFLIKKMKLKEKIAELRAMAPPQDQEEDPFSEEELMN